MLRGTVYIHEGRGSYWNVIESNRRSWKAMERDGKLWNLMEVSRKCENVP